MLNALAARATAAKWSLQNKLAREQGLETAEKLVITGIVVVLAVGVFLFIARIVSARATTTGADITNSTGSVTIPT